MNAAQRQFAAPPTADQFGRHVPLVAQLALGVLAAFGLVIAMRRLAIGQAAPIALPTTLATAVALLLMVLAIRKAAAGHLAAWLPTAMLALWAVACSYPGSQVLAWLVWGAAIAADWFAAHRTQHQSPMATVAPLLALDAGTTASDADTRVSLATEASETGAFAIVGDDSEDGEVVLQHVVRVRDRDGNEYVHATLRGEFAAGERRTTLHVGFCPPFPVLPSVEAEIIEGPPGVAKVVQALHNGVQVEVDLDEASLEPTIVTVEVAAYQGEESGVPDQGPLA